MAKLIVRWSVSKLVYMIVKTLLNDFDAFLIIEGNRGLGKSTLAIEISRKVAKCFKLLGMGDQYKFHWDKSLIYTKKETLSFFHRWQQNGIGDEMINITFNRDFYDPDQKNIIKIINMNRDHLNLFIACVPQFQTLDTQIKNLCKIRITVVRRGLAIIQTPNRTIYVKDKWDQATNEKFEREWLQKGMSKPAYSKLTTFRGILRFPKLHPSIEEKYIEVKKRKRNLVAKEEMGIEDQTEEKDPYVDTIQRLIDGKIRNGVFLDGLAHAYDINPTTFKNRLRSDLNKKGISTKLIDYYWDKQEKNKKKSAASV